MTSHRIIYFGMFGPLSRLPLAALLDAGITIAAVVVPSQTNTSQLAPLRPLIPPPGQATRPTSFAAMLKQTIVDLAWARGIPALEVTRLADEAVIAALAAFAPDLIVVSCFPFRFPAKLLALPRGGVLNLHPSPLPRGRGPDPSSGSSANRRARATAARASPPT
ncbi:MAG: formyltransferase family protein [Chloroflexia bacterium]